MTNIEPIPVGPFRSTLESWWASYLDDEGLRWKYEKLRIPIGPGTYTPDFVVQLAMRSVTTGNVRIDSDFVAVIVELKPTVEQAQADHRLRRASGLVDNLCMHVVPWGFDWRGFTVPGAQVWHSDEESFHLFIRRVLG